MHIAVPVPPHSSLAFPFSCQLLLPPVNGPGHWHCCPKVARHDTTACTGTVTSFYTTLLYPTCLPYISSLCYCRKTYRFPAVLGEAGLLVLIRTPPLPSSPLPACPVPRYFMRGSSTIGFLFSPRCLSPTGGAPQIATGYKSDLTSTHHAPLVPFQSTCLLILLALRIFGYLVSNSNFESFL